MDSLSRVLPTDSLWSSSTRYISLTPPVNEVNKALITDIPLSIAILAFFIILILFSREIFTILPHILKSTFNLKNHYKIEDKQALSHTRDIVFAITLLFIPLIITIVSSPLYEKLQYFNTAILFLLLVFSFFVLMTILKHILFVILGWLNNDKNTFNILEKVGFNYFITGSIAITLPLLIRVITDNSSTQTNISGLIICVLPIYILYLIRGYQIIISNKYSPFFYILYLCGAEILPIVLIVHFILTP